MALTGKELFPERKMKLANGKFYTFSFTFRSLAEIQEYFEDDLVKVFNLFADESHSTKTLMLQMWACLLQEHEELRGLKEKDIRDFMMDLVDPELIVEIRITCAAVFGNYWIKVQKAEGNLPPELQQVIDEMNEKGKKKK